MVTDNQNNRTIFTNNGDGSFSRGLSFVKEYRTQIKSGDVNGDGYSDIIIPDNQNAAILIKLNDGVNEIGFSDSLLYSGMFSDNPSFRGRLLCTDINKNGYDDIIQYSWRLSTIINNGEIGRASCRERV